MAGADGLAGVLTRVRGLVAAGRYDLNVPDATAATRTAAGMVAQLDDYLLPRLARLDAPLLVVVGGSTGAGKSTLVNSLVRAPVSAAGVLRPTTRAPVLVCHPADEEWFGEANLLPGLGRTSRPGGDPRVLQVVATPRLDPGLALLDAPDIDSVVEANRALAGQLLAAADLWLFVTTAARYADAVPWDVLREARDRGTAIALVLDRVPAGAGEPIGEHLTEMLTAQGLDRIPLFVVAESTLDEQGLLPEAALASMRNWFAALARSANARAAVVRQTVDGAVRALARSLLGLAAAADHQVRAADALTSAVATAHRAAAATVEAGVLDGSLLRGEVLARWQDLIGTGEFMRGLQARVASVRDRVASALTGRPRPVEQVAEAVGSGLTTLIRGAAEDAAEASVRAWRAHPAGADLPVPGTVSPERVERLVRDWQRGVLDLVRAEAGNKRYVAKAGAYAVNALGLAVMVMVFTATAFIPTGAEVAVGAGTTIAGQKVLEAIFGEQAVRQLAATARQDLLARVGELLDEQAAGFGGGALSAIDRAAGDRLRAVAAEVTAAAEDKAVADDKAAAEARSAAGRREDAR
jgi:hypothetical protein